VSFSFRTCGKDGKDVNKLLGLLVLGLAFSLTVGVIGCNPEKKKDEVKKDESAKTDPKKDPKTDPKTDPKKDPKVGEKDAEVKIKTIDAEVSLKKKEKANKVTVELEEAAPAELALKAWAKDTKDDVLTGTGKIEKGKKSGDIIIITGDVPATLKEVTIDVTGEKVKKTSLTIKVKVVD